MAKSSKAPAKGKKKNTGPIGSLSPDRRRRIYVAYRIPMVTEELEKLGKEAESLMGKLQNKDLPQESQERMKDIERLVFLTEYRPVLMKELQGLRGKKDRLKS
ncbi:MAG TPA: hypothetical protein VLC74_11895 [Rhizomicrobium sp.]|nr:hypothetical protein [Rhizomicrobium sp.]